MPSARRKAQITAPWIYPENLLDLEDPHSKYGPCQLIVVDPQKMLKAATHLYTRDIPYLLPAPVGATSLDQLIWPGYIFAFVQYDQLLQVQKQVTFALFRHVLHMEENVGAVFEILRHPERLEYLDDRPIIEDQDSLVGKSATVIAGPFINFTGVITEVLQFGRIKMKFSVFGRLTLGDVSQSDITINP